MLQILQHPLYGVLVMALLGACVGSFLNVVILRLPVMMQREWRQQCKAFLDDGPVADHPAADHTGDVESSVNIGEASQASSVFNLNRPRSRCPSCHNQLKAWHNIPILSYLLLRGRCAWCSSTIGWRYPLVELVTAAATVYLTLHFGIVWALPAALLFTWSLICLTVIDIDHQLLPDNITLPLLWGGLIANLFGLFAPLQSAVIGAVAGYLGFWLIFQIHHKLTGREGLGYGDFKLLAALGAWVGWELLPLTILIASATGTVVALGLMLLRRLNLRAPMSFGPFLAVAGWIAMVWGERITEATLPLFQF